MITKETRFQLYSDTSFKYFKAENNVALPLQPTFTSISTFPICLQVEVIFSLNRKNALALC